MDEYPPGTLRPVFLLPAQILLTCEEIDRNRLDDIKHAIQHSGRWTRPLVVSCFHHVLMDGHHRLAAALELDLFWLPCVVYSYSEVTIVARRPGYNTTPQEIIKRAHTRTLYPTKTTRHIFPDRAFEHPENVWQSISIPLADLKTPYLRIPSYFSSQQQ